MEKTTEYYEELRNVIQLLENNNPDEALSYIEKLTETYYNHDEIYFLLARTSFHLRCYADALKFSYMAWEMDDSVQEYADIIAILLVVVGRFKDSAFYAKMALTIKPHPVLKNISEDSLKNYRRILKLSKTYSENLSRAILEYKNSNYYKSALLLEYEYNNTYINTVVILEYLVRCYKHLNILEFSTNKIEEYCKLAPTDYEAQSLLATAYLKASEDKNKVLQIVSNLKNINTLESLEQAYNIEQNLLGTNNMYGLDTLNARTIVSQNYTKELQHPKAPIWQTQLPENQLIRILFLLDSSDPNIAYIRPILFAPDDFHISIYDFSIIDNLDITSLKTGISYYRNVGGYDITTISRMMSCGEYDIIIDFLGYNTYNHPSILNNRYAKFQVAYPLGIEKINIDAIMAPLHLKNKISDYLLNNNKQLIPLPAPLTTLKIETPISYEAPAITNGIISMGVVFDGLNLTEKFLIDIAYILHKISYINLIIGYNEIQGKELIDKVYAFFEKQELQKRVIFLIQSPQMENSTIKYEPRLDFIYNVDIFLNGAHSNFEAILECLNQGIVPFSINYNSLESLFCSQLTYSATGNQKDYLYDNVVELEQGILEVISDKDNFLQIRKELNESTPKSNIFNTNLFLKEFYTSLIKTYTNLGFNNESELQ